MAEMAAKRTSAKVATPKSSGSPVPGDVMEAAVKALGARVRVTNTLNTTLEGTLFTADPQLRAIALHTTRPPPPPSTNPSAVPGDYHVLPITAIRDFQLLSLGESMYPSQTAPARIDARSCELRLAKRVDELKQEEQHRGEGVTEEAQRLYDALRKLLIPIRWHGGPQGTQMVIYDGVIVDPPFEPSNCKAPSDKQDLKERAKRAIEGQRKKLGMSGEVRKGG